MQYHTSTCMYVYTLYMYTWSVWVYTLSQLLSAHKMYLYALRVCKVCSMCVYCAHSYVSVPSPLHALDRMRESETCTARAQLRFFMHKMSSFYLHFQCAAGLYLRASRTAVSCELLIMASYFGCLLHFGANEIWRIKQGRVERYYCKLQFEFLMLLAMAPQVACKIPNVKYVKL